MHCFILKWQWSQHPSTITTPDKLAVNVTQARGSTTGEAIFRTFTLTTKSPPPTSCACRLGNASEASLETKNAISGASPVGVLLPAARFICRCPTDLCNRFK